MARKWLAAVFLMLLLVLSACADKGHWYNRDVLEFRTSAWYTYLIYYPNNQPPQVLDGFGRSIFSRFLKSRGYEWVKEEKGKAIK